MLNSFQPVRKNNNFKIYLSTLIIFIFFTNIYSQDTKTLKLDPALLVSLKECQKIATQLGDKLYPGWDFNKTPILLYKPNVQELLINYPHKPKGFSEYTGFNPLNGQKIYVRNETTFIKYDDQNTTYLVEGIDVLVVADTYSSMRAQLRGITMNQTKEQVVKWLDNWSFIGSPYHKLSTILHEGFHVYQNLSAPNKNANEGSVASYPFLNPINNSLYELEGAILKDALFAKDKKRIIKKINEFVAVRTHRQSLLDSVFVAYENLNEFKEGTAKYIQYKMYSEGKNMIPIKEMKYVNGFTDYKIALPKIFKNEIEDMVKIVGVKDNRFGNRFGAGPLRFKLYDLGACQGLLLDKVMPEWKNNIFKDGVYLSDLLDEATNLSKSEKIEHLNDAKSAYNYDLIYKEKLAFQKEGKKVIQEKVYAIMKSKNTLVVINYKGHKIRGLSYTPFGITKVTDYATIYEMTPIGIYFDKVRKLISKTQFPVLVNTKEEKVYFSIKTAIDEFTAGTSTKLSMKEFELVAEEINIVKEANRVIITFK